jgi:hypothetical protein
VDAGQERKWLHCLIEERTITTAQARQGPAHCTYRFMQGIVTLQHAKREKIQQHGSRTKPLRDNSYVYLKQASNHLRERLPLHE